MPRNEMLVEARIKKGLTQKELAAACGISVSSVQAYEEIGVRPQPAQMRRLLEVLAAPDPPALGFAPTRRHGPRGTVARGGAGRGGHRDVLRRRDLLSLAVGAMGGVLTAPMDAILKAPKDRINIGASDVEWLRSLYRHSTELERMMGGGIIDHRALIRTFGEQYAKLHGVFRSVAVKQDMHEAVVYYGLLAAWSLVERGEHALAQRIHAAALVAAKTTRPDRKAVVQARVLINMARQAMYLDDYAGAVALFDNLVHPLLIDLPDDVRGVVYAREARALGGLGKFKELTKLAHQAEEVFGTSAQTSADEYRDHCLGVAEMTNDLGQAYSNVVVLHGVDTPEASRRLVQSMESYGSGDAQSRALVAVQLGNVHLASGEPARAVVVLQEHANLTRTVKSVQIQAMAKVGLDLASRRKQERGMADVIELYRDIQQ